MENKRFNDIKKEYLINKNLELLKILVHICGGCCLQHQLRELLINIKSYDTKYVFYKSVKELEDNKLIVRKKFSSTNNYVIFASRYTIAKLNKKEINQVTALTQDIYVNRKKIFLSIFKLENLLDYTKTDNVISKEQFFKYINNSSIRYSKNQGYKSLIKLAKLSKDKNLTDEGKSKYIKMKYRVEKNKSKITNKSNSIYMEPQNINNYDFDTLLARNIYFFSCEKNIYEIYIFDTMNNANPTKLGKYIKDTHVIFLDTLDNLESTKFIFNICVINEQKKISLEKNLHKVISIAKVGGYITEYDLALEKIEIKIKDYEIEKKYFQQKNLINLLGV